MFCHGAQKWPRHCGASRGNFGVLPGPRVSQRPRPWKSPEEALWAARDRGCNRALAFRRDGLRVFILDTVFYDVSGIKKKVRFARCFCPDRIRTKHSEFLPKATVRNNSPPCGLAPWCRQAGGGEGWVGLGWVVWWLAGWLAGGMVHGA